MIILKHVFQRLLTMAIILPLVTNCVAGEARVIEPKEDIEVLGWLHAWQSGKDDNLAAKAYKSLTGIDKDRLLASLAFALGSDKYCDPALVYMNSFVKDPGLVEYIRECMKTASGWRLYMALQVAKAHPSSQYLPVIFTSAIKDKFNETSVSPPPEMERSTKSSWVETAELLHIITNGEVGLKAASGVTDDNRVRLTVEWEKWWTTNSEKYQRTGKDSGK